MSNISGHIHDRINQRIFKSLHSSETALEYLDLDTTDPRLNLAIEESLLRDLPATHPGYLLLWQNDPSVIIGRHQCLPEVVNIPYAEENALPVIRRITGGGAVYHDAGNLNFSFITAGKGDFAHFLDPIVEALSAIGVKASISGRNDLEVKGKKISGSARLVLGGKVLVHGTLLVSLDFERMTSALRVDEGKIKSKGVASIRARVANICELAGKWIDIITLKKIIAASCGARKAALNPQTIAARELARQKYASRDWNYGQSPPFNLEKRARFPWGGVTIRLEVKKGRIRGCAINGDFFNVAPMAQLEKRFLALPFEPKALEAALADICWQDYFLGCEEAETGEFFTKRLFLDSQKN